MNILCAAVLLLSAADSLRADEGRPEVPLTLRVDVGADTEGSMTALAAFRLSRTFALEVADDDSSVNLRRKGPLLALDIGF